MASGVMKSSNATKVIKSAKSGKDDDVLTTIMGTNASDAMKASKSYKVVKAANYVKAETSAKT